MPNKSPLSCRLFGHRPVGEPVWNQGFYFGSCRRCGVDLVRTPGERWHRPRKARVVWRTTPPPTVRQACLERIEGTALHSWSELPPFARISGPAEKDICQGRQSPSTVREERRSAIPDFMDDAEVPMRGTSTARPAEGSPAKSPHEASRPARVA